MRTLFVIGLLFIGLLYGCKNKNQTTEQEEFVTIYPLEQSTMVTDIKPYIDSLEVLPLETNEKSYISHIRKILYTASGNIVILNSTGIIVFDFKGKHLFTIDKEGRGPDEYQGAVDICINDEQHLFVLSSTSDVFKFSLEDGRFLEKITPQVPIQSYDFCEICPSEKDGFFLYALNMQFTADTNKLYCLLKFDQKGKFIDQFLPQKEFIFSIALITQSYNNSYIIRSQETDKICYKVQEGKVVPYVKIDFKDKGIPSDVINTLLGPDLDIQKFMFSNYYKLPTYIHETAEQLYFSFCGPDAMEHYCVHSFKNSKSIIWKRTSADNTSLFAITGSDSTYFYGIYNDYTEEYTPEELQDIAPLKKAVIEKTHLKLGESNPVIVKIKFKL